jgi:PEP-CTERM motif
MKVVIRTSLTALALVAVQGSAQAAICEAKSLLTNPDATLTNSTECGVGILNDQNDSAADINFLEILGFKNWSALDKVDAPATTGVRGNLTTTGTSPAGSAGSWGFDDLTGYDDYVLVIKDGGAPGGKGDSIFWSWFVVDTASNCDAASAIDDKDYCGLWSMYGDNGNIKNISHLQLYGRLADGGGGGDEIPEPASLALVGLGLFAAAATRRRKVKPNQPA